MKKILLAAMLMLSMSAHADTIWVFDTTVHFTACPECDEQRGEHYAITSHREYDTYSHCIENNSSELDLKMREFERWVSADFNKRAEENKSSRHEWITSECHAQLLK
jgi:hypothetical protein